MNEAQLSSTSTSRANSFPWPPVLLVCVIAAALLAGRFWPLPWPGLDDAPAQAIGLSFGVVGTLLIASSVGLLLSRGTTLLPTETSTVLVTDGPYRRFRNPIYLGEVLLLLTAAEITKSIWFVGAALGFAILVTALQIIPEERHLESQFGEAYIQYKSRARRWI